MHQVECITNFEIFVEKGQFISLLIGENQLEIMQVTIDNELIRKRDKSVLKLTSFQKHIYTIDMVNPKKFSFLSFTGNKYCYVIWPTLTEDRVQVLRSSGCQVKISFENKQS